MFRTLSATTALLSALTTLPLISQPVEARVVLLDSLMGDAVHLERRIALVVGNSNYLDEKIRLPNPQNDAADMAAMLRKLGFEVVVAIDASKQEFEGKLAQFARMGANADTALFFYAGHALQFQGENYLMPTDGELRDAGSVAHMVRVEDVRKALARVNGLKVMILDACRNNPLTDRNSRPPGGNLPRGLAESGKADGMIVAYATAPDDVAEDGKGRNSPFTGALLNRLAQPGLEITKMFRMVGADVSAATGGRQHPEISLQSYNDYYINQTDRLAWDKIKNSDDAVAVEDFVAKFATSSYLAAAKEKLIRLANAAQQSSASAIAVPLPEAITARPASPQPFLPRRQIADTLSDSDANTSVKVVPVAAEHPVKAIVVGSAALAVAADTPRMSVHVPWREAPEKQEAHPQKRIETPRIAHRLDPGPRHVEKPAKSEPQMRSFANEPVPFSPVTTRVARFETKLFREPLYATPVASYHRAPVAQPSSTNWSPTFPLTFHCGGR